MRFLKLAEFFERVEKVASRLQMTNVLAELFEQVPQTDIKNAIYLTQGMLAPIFEGIKIGIGEKLMIEAIAKAYGYTSNEVEKQYKNKGDLGTVAEELASKKKQQALFSEELSLKKVKENLLKVAKTEGTGSQELKLKLLAELLNSSTPIEARYITRITLENLRLGIGDPTIMDSIAISLLDEAKKDKTLLKEATEALETKKTKGKKEKQKEELERQLKFRVRARIEEKYNIFADLGAIAEILKEKGLKGIEKVDISPGIPIRPTLAERLETPEEIIKKLGKCAVEKKYDGFRLQVHKNGNDVKIFSRQSENMTHMFPEIVKAVKEQVNAKQAIFEAEALAVNEETQEFFPFQITIQRKRKYDIEEKAKAYPLKAFAFDAMFIDGKNLMNLSFKERRERLQKLIKKGEVLELTDAIETDSPKELEKYFLESVSEGLEGIIAKDLKAKYIAGARKFAWIKLKRSYRGELSDTIDCVVIGYFKGRGKRTQFGLGALLTAVYNQEKDLFESIAKLGTGISEEQLKELFSILSKIKTSKKSARVVTELEPDEWVEPKIVLEIKADEITKSPIHSAGKEKEEGYALRFPRMQKIRTDKKPEECTSVKEIIKMFKAQRSIATNTFEGAEKK